MSISNARVRASACFCAHKPGDNIARTNLMDNFPSQMLMSVKQNAIEDIVSVRFACKTVHVRVCFCVRTLRGQQRALKFDAPTLS